MAGVLNIGAPIYSILGESPIVPKKSRTYDVFAVETTRRLLIVDDENDILVLLRFYFTTRGWEVATVSDGAAALKAFEADRFQVLLADVDLGDGMDGIEVSKRLLDQHPHLKVVIMSGKQENAARVRDAKVGTFIGKPFDLLNLGSILNAALV